MLGKVTEIAWPERLAVQGDSIGHAEALHEELECWDTGERDPEKIASVWCERLHTDKVAKMILDFKF